MFTEPKILLSLNIKFHKILLTFTLFTKRVPYFGWLPFGRAAIYNYPKLTFITFKYSYINLKFREDTSSRFSYIKKKNNLKKKKKKKKKKQVKGEYFFLLIGAQTTLKSQ